MKRTLIIGDIHGCCAELLDLCEVAALGADDIVVSVGDLVDRGPEPAAVVRWFRQRPAAVVLMGNHERKHVRGVFSYSQEVCKLQIAGEYEDAVAWMRDVPYYWETPEIRVVHAALMPGVPLAQQDENVLCGSTAGEAILKKATPYAWWHERYTDPVPVAFGHHVTGNDAAAYLASITAWAGSVRAVASTFIARVEAIAAELRGDFDAHPAKPLLFKLARSRLTDKDIAERCTSIAATLALAEKLGVEMAGLGAPAG